MSENADIALRAFEAFSRNDLEAGLDAIDPDIEWHVTFRVPDLPPDKTVLRGHDEVRRLWASLREAWEEFTLEREEILYDRDDLLVERVRFRGRGSASGVEVDRVIWYVEDLRDARLVRIRPFESRDEALAAAGVSA